MEEYIRQFINRIVPEVDVIFEDDEFWVDVEDQVINIGMNTNPEGNRLIQEFVFNEFGVAMHSFIIGVLHEIGHILTYDKQIYEEGTMMYLMLQMNYDERHLDEYSLMYFNIPNEYRATEWAVNYYLAFQEECDEFADMIL